MVGSAWSIDNLFALIRTKVDWVYTIFGFPILPSYPSGGVTPRPTGYGDATATYIHRIKYPYLYTLSISIQSGIRVQKHSINIDSNITVQVYCYHMM